MTAVHRPRAVIFDWDDTVVDTWDVVRTAVNTTLEAFGHEAWTEEKARKTLGPPARVLYSALFGEDKWEEADRIHVTAYRDNIAGKLRVIPGAEEVFRALEKAGVHMTVVSSKRGWLLREEALALGYDGFFAKLVGAGDAPLDKPAREAVCFALEGSGIAPGPDVWFVGDSHTDMLCALNAGCTPVLIETKPPPPEKLAATPPALRCADHAALLALLREAVAA